MSARAGGSRTGGSVGATEYTHRRQSGFSQQCSDLTAQVIRSTATPPATGTSRQITDASVNLRVEPGSNYTRDPRRVDDRLAP